MICIILQLLLCTLPNCSSKNLYQYSCQLAVYNWTWNLEGIANVFSWFWEEWFQILSINNSVCPEPEDTEMGTKEKDQKLECYSFFSQGEDCFSCFSWEDCLHEGAGESLLTLYSYLLRRLPSSPSTFLLVWPISADKHRGVRNQFSRNQVFFFLEIK